MTTRVTSLLLLGALTLLLARPAAAADPHDCAAVATDSQRLACYDAIFGRGEAAAAQPALPTATPPTPPAVRAEQSFGAEQLPAHARDKPPEPAALQAHIQGSFEGWEPNTRFTLDNGQIWQVVDDRSVYYPPTTAPQVTIEKGMFGAYFLQLDGLNARARVKRIR